jgi:hypothetical protein
MPDTEKIRERLRELKQYRKLDDACEAANIFGDTLEKVLDECVRVKNNPMEHESGNWTIEQAVEPDKILDIIQNELCEEVE